MEDKFIEHAGDFKGPEELEEEYDEAGHSIEDTI